MTLNGVIVIGDNPEQYVRQLAADALGVDDADLTFVTFTTDADGMTIADGRVFGSSFSAG